MGISGIRAVSYHIIMKFFIVSALVAAVSAEAQLGYAGYAGYPYAAGYAGLGHLGYGALPYAGPPAYAHHPYAAVPFGSSTGLDPITQGLDPVTQGLVYRAGAQYGKREAEANADAQVVSPYTAGYSGYPYAAGYAVIHTQLDMLAIPTLLVML